MIRLSVAYTEAPPEFIEAAMRLAELMDVEFPKSIKLTMPTPEGRTFSHMEWTPLTIDFETLLIEEERPIDQQLTVAEMLDEVCSRLPQRATVLGEWVNAAMIRRPETP